MSAASAKSESEKNYRGPLQSQPTFASPGLSDLTYLRSGSQYVKSGDQDSMSAAPANKPGQNKGSNKSFNRAASLFGMGLPSLESNMSFARKPDDDETKSLLGQGIASDHSLVGGRANPEVTASWLSLLFFSYANQLITLGSKKHLQQTDLWETAPHDLSDPVYASYQKTLAVSVDEDSPEGKISSALIGTYGRAFFWNGVLKMIHDLIMFSPPFILERLLVHQAKPQPSKLVSFGLSFALLAAAALENLTINQYFHQLFRMSLHIKINMIEMLYGKSLRVTSGVKSALGVGSILNLQSNDASKIWGLPQYLHIVWNGPFQILVINAMLIRILGPWATLAGFLVTVIMIPLSTLVGKSLGTARKEMMKQADARVKLSTEIITGIKAIKLYAWENAYSEKISGLREKELAQIRKTQLLSSFNMVVFMSGPVLVSLAAFGVFTAQGRELTAAIAFPALALFNLLRFPILMFPSQIMNLINAQIGLDRIQKFVEKEETPGINYGADSSSAVDARSGADALLGVKDSDEGVPGWSMAVSVQGGSFCWDKDKAPVLKSISLRATQGQLVMVVGQVGGGKSSLLQALLGEMHKKCGSVKVVGSVAFTAQDPWIQNSTVRNNILMGEEYAEEAYMEVLAACALVQDLEMLQAGDASEIGEKGINLSGGQKHRVALARAAYAAADVYLLDDPLSAVDAHVGRHIFDQCICGLLSYSTRILVTHQLQYLPSADLVVVMSEGEILDQGSYEDLIERGVDVSAYIKPPDEAGKKVEETTLPVKAPVLSNPSMVEVKASSGSAVLDKSDKSVSFEPGVRQASTVASGSIISVSDRTRLIRSLSLKKEDGEVTKAEERAVGQVKHSVYMSYVKAWSSFLYIVPILVLVFAFAERGLQIGQNFVLAIWSNADTSTHGHADPKGYLALYIILGLVSIVFQMFRSLMTIKGSITASRSLYQELQAKVVRLPMSFFDSQPTGRLLNRFTKDTETIDISISGVVSMTLTTVVSAGLSTIVILIVSPLSIVALLPLAYVYYRVQALYIASSRELKRLDSIAFSPIFSHFSETLNGLVSIRAFRKQNIFHERNVDVLDNSNRAWWPAQIVNRWLSVRLEMMGSLIVFSAAFFVTVVMPRNPGLVGLVITSALNLTGIMNWMVRQVTELEINMNSVERVIEYYKLEEEAPAESTPGKAPPPSWPALGVIEVKELQVRYRPEFDLVLKGITFDIKSREKVGVCGRTGCGKSTLFMALYRIIEPCGGSVVIDGIDVGGIGLRDLRSKLALVPQDPVIFSGTVRSNLDPFNQASSDADIWEALTRAGSDGFVRELDQGLDSVIKEGGANISVGQRQLLCMARALLRQSRILFLDEATSNVDNATDGLIQNTIRSAFKDCSVLTIAHRLHTVIDSDRILVLDAGEVAEFDTPSALLRNPVSEFRRLVDETLSQGSAAGGASDSLSSALSSALGQPGA